MKRYLGIDYGARRMGLALADDEVRLANPFKTIDPSQLLATIEQAGPFDTIVIGLPRSLDGRETPQTLAVRRYCEDILGDLGTEIVYQDEAATSSVAEERLRESGRKYTKEDIDAEAATIILQDYLGSL
jgi:putative Holliday junction resolvase